MVTVENHIGKISVSENYLTQLVKHTVTGCFGVADVCCVNTFRSVVAALNPSGFGWLLAGGIIYTVGGVIYAIKLTSFNQRHPNFGTHEIFHIFCIAGSMCHYILMYLYVL